MKKKKYSEALQDILFSLDFLDSKPNLFFKDNYTQHTVIGLILSIIIYITIFVIFLYYLFVDNYTVTLTYGKSSNLESNVMKHPILFRLFDKDNGLPIGDDYYNTYIFLPRSVEDFEYEFQAIKCGTFKNNTEYMNKYSKVLNTIKDWENYYCLDPNHISLSHSSYQMTSENYFIIEVVSEKIVKYINKTMILKIHNIFPDIEKLIKTDKIKYKSFTKEFDINIDYYNEIYGYYSNSSFIVEGNEIKDNINYNFVEYQYMTCLHYFKDITYDLYDENNNLRSNGYQFTIISVDFFLENKNPVYNKKYKKIYNILGNVGGIINILMIISNFINKIIIDKIIRFDIVENFFNAKKINENKKIKKNINISNIPINQSNDINRSNSLKNNYILNLNIPNNNNSFEKIFKFNNNNNITNDICKSNNITFKNTYLNVLLYLFPLDLLKYNNTLKNNIDVFQYCFNNYFSFEALYHNINYIKEMNKNDCYKFNYSFKNNNIV